MSLSNELKRSWSLPRLRSPQHLKIAQLALEIEQQFGVLPVEPRPPKDYLDEARKILIEHHGRLEHLNRRHRKSLPWILWSLEHAWAENRTLVDDWLSWADAEWRTSPKRLWRHYLLHLDPESYATQALATWLEARQDRLSETLRTLSSNWQLFSPSQAIALAAQRLIRQESLSAELEPVKLEVREVLRSSFLLRVLQELGKQLQHNAPCAAGVANHLQNLLTSLGKEPLAMMYGSAACKRQSLKGLVEGVVAWAQRCESTDEALDLLLLLADDPRLHPLRWQAINEEVRVTVEGWLTKVTLESFFQVMLALLTDRDDMVQEREEFWRAYYQQGVIKSAWMIVARDGEQLARKVLGSSFGTFASGASSAQRDHCGLLLQIGHLMILEMNKKGSTFFWEAGDGSMPGNFAKVYDRARMRELIEADPLRRFILKHHPGWQWKYHDAIYKHTGISRP